MERTFGVELEFVGVDNHKAARVLRAVRLEADVVPYGHVTRPGWGIVTDASVRDSHGNRGYEAVSPILAGEAGKKAAATAANALKAAGASCPRCCGTHIHVGVGDLGVEEIKTIFRRYAMFEAEIDAFMPPSRRANANQYCQSIRAFVESRAFQNARAIGELRSAQPGRFYKVNLQSYNSDRKTLEFRQHQGIVDADRLILWVRFLQDFVAESVRIARNPTPAAMTPSVPAADTSPAVRRLTGAQQRLLDMMRQSGGVTAEAAAARLGIQIHSARAVVTRIRQAGYNVQVVRRDGEARYEVAGDAAPAAAPASARPARTNAAGDSLYAGVDAEVAEFYRNRAAVLAIA